jgi:hypothetical protein
VPVFPTPPAAAAGSDTASQLQQVAHLYTSGVLIDEEFAAATQKILSGG